MRSAFDQGGLRDLTKVGAGTARWVAASIRLAIHELRTATRQICDESGAPIESYEAARDAIEAAREDPLNQRALRLDPTSLAPALYLIDEPEAHLHPTAMRSVITWLRDVSERGHGAIVATHNPALVSQLSPHATVYLVRGDGTTTTVTDVSDDVVGELTRLAGDFGLTPGDLLLMTRMALFVEGPHDVAVLDAIGGDELALAGVRIFPLHGVRNALALVDSEIIAALGIRLAVLTDHTDRERLRAAQPQSSEERASLRLLREARASGRRISPFGLAKPDIVMYLDDQACRAQADRFPGWEEADRAWGASDRSLDLKSFVAAKYGLHLTRDVVYQLAIATRLAARVPHELRACIQAIGARAQDDSGVPSTS